MSKNILSLLSLVHLVNDGYVLLVPTMLPFIAKDMGFSYLEIGVLGGSMLTTGMVSQFFLGYFSDCIKKKKRLIAIGIVLCSISLFFIGISKSYLQLLLLSLLAGIGWGVYHPVGVSILSEHYRGSNGKAFGIHGASGSIGLAVFPLAAGLLAEYFGWRTAFKLLPIVGITIGTLFLFLTKGEEKESEKTRPKKWDFVTKEVIAVILVFSFFSMGMGGFTIFFPVKLNILGFSPSSIGFYLSVFYSINIVGQYIGGMFMDRYDARKIISLSLFTTGLFLYLLLESSQFSIFFLILTSFFSAIAMPVLFAYIPNRTPVENRGTALGMFFGISSIFSATSPIFMGYITESFSLDAAFLFLPLACSSGAFLMMKMKGI